MPDIAVVGVINTDQSWKTFKPLYEIKMDEEAGIYDLGTYHGGTGWRIRQKDQNAMVGQSMKSKTSWM